MPASAEPTVVERLSWVDRLKAEARQFAAKIRHENREYRRSRSEAALLVAEAIGVPYSSEKLRKSGCWYIRIDGTPAYRDADLQALSESILDRALKWGRDPRSPPLLTAATPATEISNTAVVRRGKRRPRSQKSAITAGSDVVA